MASLKAPAQFVWQLIGWVTYLYALIFKCDKLADNSFTIWLAIQKSYLKLALTSSEQMQVLSLKVMLLLNALRLAQFATLTFIPVSEEWRFLLADQMLIMGTDASKNFDYLMIGGVLGGYINYQLFFLPQQPGKGVTWLILSCLNESVQDRDKLMRTDAVKLNRMMIKTVKFFVYIELSWRKCLTD